MTAISIEQLSFVGHGLSRPECALAHSSGMIFAPDWTGDGGISAIFPNGTVKRLLASNWSAIAKQLSLDEPLRPNGICLLEGGHFLLAHLGAERGGIFSLAPDGTVSIFLSEVDGEQLPPSNFVTVDQQGRIWITVSTRQVPRAAAYRSDVADGFIVLMENGVARIVADGLGYTNECLVHPDGERVFVNETFARRLTSFDIAADGNLSNRTTIAELGEGVFPDGLAFDEHGDAWLTSIVSNRVLRVATDGTVEIYLEDADANHLEWVEKAWRDHSMGRPHLDKAAGRVLRNVSNLAFCGENLDQAVLGCLLGEELTTFPMPVRGQQPVQWTFDIDPLLRALKKTNSI
ncbi:MAG: gluconolactonase [Rhizobiaceae bacterium]|nr:gluconolactonase [Rhizobiaceae bacterium]